MSEVDQVQLVDPYLIEAKPTDIQKQETMNTTSKNPLFALGQVVATPGALELLESAGKAPSHFISKHQSGDWGDDLCEESKELNDKSIQDGSRLISAYTVGNDKIWVISEADRSSTTLLLPSEY